MTIFPLAPNQIVAQMWPNGVQGVTLCSEWPLHGWWDDR